MVKMISRDHQKPVYAEKFAAPLNLGSGIRERTHQKKFDFKFGEFKFDFQVLVPYILAVIWLIRGMLSPGSTSFSFPPPTSP